MTQAFAVWGCPGLENRDPRICGVGLSRAKIYDPSNGVVRLSRVRIHEPSS